MIVIVCVDEKNGMMFNNRRQSKDRIVINRIMEKVKNSKLWIGDYSKELFDNENNKNIIVDDNFYKKAEKEDYCFIEDIDIDLFIEKVDKIILYNWNRRYPADKYFSISLENWKLISREDFRGFSHENITEKVFI